MSGGFNFGLPAVDLGGGLAGIGKMLTLSSEQERKRALAGQLGAAVQSGDYAGAAKAAFDAGDADTGLGLVKLGQLFKKQELEQKASEDFAQGLGGMFGQSGGGAMRALNPDAGGASAPTRGGAVSFGDTSGPSGGYLASLMTRESNNNPNARNPNSTAMGLGQFTEGTWTDLARRRPDLGLTPNGRTDPDQARRATAAFTQENESLLSRVGLPVTDVTRYAMHFLGKRGGVQFLKGAENNPDAPASAYADPSSVSANRAVFFNRNGTPKTARDVLADFGRSFGGRGGGGGAPAQSQVAYADDEAQTQALEQRMGMMPAGGGVQTAEADMPAAGTREAAFYIPGTDPAASTPAPFGGNQRAPDRDRSALGNADRARAQSAGLPAPTLPGAGLGGPAGPVMTLPGDGGAPGAGGGGAPVQVADAGGSVGNVPAAQIMQTPLSQRIPFLMRQAASANLPDHQRQLAQSLLKQAFDETKMSDGQKDYQMARAQGFTGTYLDYQRELKRPGGPTVLSAGQTVYDEKTNTGRYTAPTAEKSSNVTADVEARRATAAETGLSPGSPAYQSYVLTGKMPREDAQSLTALDKKSIQDADAAVFNAQNTLDMLGQAKVLSKQAYEGPTASARGTVTGLFGNEAGVATQDLDNLVTTQALGQLKAIFGGAPTEGERKILLDIQGSSSKPDVVRQRIYDRAMGLVRLKLQQSQDKADELRGGTYYRPGSGPRGQGDGGTMRTSPPSREAPSGSAGQPRGLPAPSQANRPGAAAPADRFQQFMGSGLSKQQAYERLQQEGY